MTSTLVVLARSPAPGVGKTRLRRVLPSPGVDAVSRAMVLDTLSWAGATGFDRVLVAHRGPAEEFREEEVREAAPEAIWREQPAGDLGTRIEFALNGALDSPGALAVQIGTDSPSLPAPLLARALAALDLAPTSLIPAADGGWIALGSAHPLKGVLGEVPWSSGVTCAETVRALTAAGLAPSVLPSHYDLDEPIDLLRLAADPGAAARAPRTLAAVAPLLDLVRALLGPDALREMTLR